jgi:hypothetical protein
MKKIIVATVALLLAGCSTPVKLIAPEYKIVKPPQDLYICPVEKRFPVGDTLTNEQVGNLLLKLQKNNITCKNSLNSIQKYIDEAEAKTATK